MEVQEILEPLAVLINAPAVFNTFVLKLRAVNFQAKLYVEGGSYIKVLCITRDVLGNLKVLTGRRAFICIAKNRNLIKEANFVFRKRFPTIKPELNLSAFELMEIFERYG